MNVLICNAGSTSLKFRLYDMPSEAVLAEARIERVGDPNGGSFKMEVGEKSFAEDNVAVPDYRAGIEKFLSGLGGIEVHAVGFKTVLSKDHYGVHILDDAAMRGMEEYMVVAPAHNKHYLEAVRTFIDVMPGVPMVGCFETGFHMTLKPEAYIYPLPYEWYEKYGVRRFGYHGASHSYAADCLNEILGEKYRAVTCHLGGSGSLAAIVDGESRETSFGLSLQCGIVQMSRAGDFDPYLIFFLHEHCGLSYDEIKEGLSKNGGLKGISGYGDMRDLTEAAERGEERAKLAMDIYIREIVRYIGSYAALMGGIDALVFTGGVGENSAAIREGVMEKLGFLGFKGCAAPKKGEISEITDADSAARAFVIPANEELGVARKTYKKLAEM